MKMVSPEGTLVNMSPPTKSTPANIQVLKYEQIYTNLNPYIIATLLSTVSPTSKLHIYRCLDIPEEPEIWAPEYETLGVSPNGWNRTALHNIT